MFDTALLAVLLVLIYAFFHQHRSRFSASFSVRPTRPSLNLNSADQHGRYEIPDTAKSIDTRIKLIPDLRSKACKRVEYSLREKASIIIDFNDYQFFDLKNTIQSVLNQNGYEETVQEIIVVDDGSTLEYIRQELDRYLKTVPKARLIQFNVQRGTLKARMAATKEARTDIVVYLEASVLCGHGWLEPLIDLLIKDRGVVALPHYDRVHSPVSLEYRGTRGDLQAAPTWNFGLRMRSTTATDPSTDKQRFFLASPALRGSAFALRRSFLDSIGSFDGDFEEGGGDILELSFRTWMCGGMIETAMCSRVAIPNFDDPLKPFSQRNCQRTAGLWFSDLRDVSLRLAGLPTAIPDADEALIAARLRYIASLRQCRDVHWYWQTVARENFIPTQNTVKFGILSSVTGRCARLANDSKIDLVDCAEVRNRTVFELTNGGRLRAYNRCMTTENTAYIVLRDCRDNDTRQLWTYKDKELRNVWSNFCATHVTDPDPGVAGRQIAMAQGCAATSERRAFLQWQFLWD